MKKILIIDDSLIARKFILKKISEVFLDANILEIEDSHLGYKICQNEKFDLIISDVYRPKINGIDMLKQVRENSKNTNTNFIFFTTNVTKSLKKATAELKVRLWMPKPINSNKFKIALTRLLIG